MPSKTLIIVHGTFNPDPDWGREGSPLVKTAREALGTDLLTLSFHWSGGNNHHSRLEASFRLQEFIRTCLSKEPQRPIYLVGHSHGGNVIFYALRDEAIAGAVEGVICLSTPFIVARERYLGNLALASLSWFLVLWVPVREWPHYWKFNEGMTLILDKTLSRLLTVLIPVLCFWFYRSWALKGIAPFSPSSRPGAPKALWESLRLASFPKEKTLLVRSLADEASAGLGIPVLGTRIFRIVLGALSGLNRWAGKIDGLAEKAFESASGDWLNADRQQKIILGMAVAVVLFFQFADIHVPYLNIGTAAVGITLLVAAALVLARYSALGILSVFKVAAAFVVSPVFLVCAVPSFFFGLDMLVFAFLMEISTEAAPPGDWELRQLDIASDGTDLSHGLTHSDPAAMKAIGDWLKKRAGGA